MKYIDGTEFSGTWKDDHMYYGKLKMLTSEIYTGYFKNNIFNGEGSIKYLDGLIASGQFINGEIGSKGKLIFPDTGNIFEGEITDLKIGK